MRRRVEQPLVEAADRLEQQVGLLDEATPEHDHLGIEEVGEVREAEREPPRELVEDLARGRVTGTRVAAVTCSPRTA